MNNPWRNPPGSRCTACPDPARGCRPSRCPGPRPCAASICACRRSIPARPRFPELRSSRPRSTASESPAKDRSSTRNPPRPADRSTSSAGARETAWRPGAPQRTPRVPPAEAQVNSRVRRPTMSPRVPTPTLARTRAELNFSKEVGNFPCRGVRRVGPMDDVLVDAGGKIGANRALGRLLRIGGAHDLAILCDRTLTLEHLHHHRTRSHEANQILEEGAFAVNCIKALRFRLRELHHARRHHPQSRLLETAIDFADQVTAHAVRLDDGKGTLDWHDDLVKHGKSAPLEVGKDREVYWSARAQAIRTATEVPVLLGKTPLGTRILTGAHGLEGEGASRQRRSSCLDAPSPPRPFTLGQSTFACRRTSSDGPCSSCGLIRASRPKNQVSN